MKIPKHRSPSHDEPDQLNPRNTQGLRKNPFSAQRTIGRKIHKELSNSDKSVEWLAFEADTARSTIRRIFDGSGNIGIVTLDRVARALGYKDVTEFFRSL
jgi:hypothetical protein